MAENKKYNSILVSGRKDETLTYSRYIKDEETGKSVKESLDGKINTTDMLETHQIKDGAITKDKLKDNTIGVEKLDPELRDFISAATGLPENLVQTIQNVDETLRDHQGQLNDKQSQIDDKQQQITSNDEDISLLQTRSTQMEEAIKSIAATGGASQAAAVTYNNANSQLKAINIQGAVDELQKKVATIILDWKIDTNQTRLSVNSSDRKTNLIISYINKLTGETVSEKYIGTTFSDNSWSNDKNWANLGLSVEEQLQNPNRGVVYIKKDEFSDIDSENIQFIINSNVFDYTTTPKIDTIVNLYNDNGIFGQYQMVHDGGPYYANLVKAWINKNPSLKLNYFGEPLKHVYDALFSHLQSNFGFTVMPFGYINKDIILNKFIASKSYKNLTIILNLDEIRAFDSKYKYLIFPKAIANNSSILFTNINGNQYTQQLFGNSLDSLDTYVALTKSSNFAYMKLDDDAYKDYKYVAFKLTDTPSTQYDLQNNIERYMYSKVGFFLNFGIALLNIYSRESYKSDYTPVQNAYDNIIKKYFTDNSSNNLIDLDNVTSGHFEKNSENKLITAAGGALVYSYIEVKQCKYYTNILNDTDFPIYALRSDKTVISTVPVSNNGIIDLETLSGVTYLAVQSAKYKWVYIIPEEHSNSGIKLYNKPSTYKGIQIFHLGDSISEGSDGRTVYMPYLLSIAKNILNESIVNNINLSSFLKYGLKISDAECWAAVKNAINESTRDKFSLITIQLGTNNGFTIPEDFESNLPTNSCADIPYDGVASIEEHLAKFPEGVAYEYCKLIEYILYYNRYCKIVFISIPEFGQTKDISNIHIATNKAIKTICDMYCVEFIDIAHISNMSNRLQKFYSTDGIHPFINTSMWWLKCAEKLIPSLLTSCFL